MDSENGRMTREEYRAQMGLDAEPNAKREKSGDAGARLILLQLIICAARIVKYIIIKAFCYIIYNSIAVSNRKVCKSC